MDANMGFSRSIVTIVTVGVCVLLFSLETAGFFCIFPPESP